MTGGRQRSLIEQRIAWTRFQRQTDKDVLLAMARWFCWRADGTCRSFYVAELAHKGRVPHRSTERALERLEADWWIEAIARKHRHPTMFRINLARLATVDPDALTATVAVRSDFDRQSGGQPDEWRSKNGRDFEKVADQSTEEEVRTDPSTAADRTLDRQSGGQRPEHPDVAAFLEWAQVTYPQHANGAHLEVDGDRRRYVVHRLLEHYGRERLEQMAVVCWTINADGDPNSHATWIAKHTDRSLDILKHKAAFLERVVVGAQQLNLGPLLERPLSQKEIAFATDVLTRVLGRCPHGTGHKFADCVREIALARRVS